MSNYPNMELEKESCKVFNISRIVTVIVIFLFCSFSFSLDFNDFPKEFRYIYPDYFTPEKVYCNRGGEEFILDIVGLKSYDKLEILLTVTLKENGKQLTMNKDDIYVRYVGDKKVVLHLLLMRGLFICSFVFLLLFLIFCLDESCWMLNPSVTVGLIGYFWLWWIVFVNNNFLS